MLFDTIACSTHADTTSARSTPCAKCGQPEREHHYNGACYGLCGQYQPESVTLATLPAVSTQETAIDVGKARDALRSMEHHRARLKAQRDLTHAQLIAQDAALAELDPLIRLWKGIVHPDDVS